jgi:hypothetical protein
MALEMEIVLQLVSSFPRPKWKMGRRNKASFDIDKDKDISRFFYSYMNTPKPSVRDRSQMHYGTTLLNFEGYPVTEMTGEYWTSRESTGEIKLKIK